MSMTTEHTNYFKRVMKNMPTRMWVNNPTAEELQKAIDAGAVCMTANPSYAAYLITNEPDYMAQVIDTAIQEADTQDAAADLVQQKIVSRAMEAFWTMYKNSNRTLGFVTIQADPREDDDADAILEAAIRHRRLGENCMPKIPVTKPGIQAIGSLIAQDVPLCATEIFSLSQAIHVCEMYESVTKRTGKHPPLFVTHITGIFDQYLQAVVNSQNVNITPEVLAQAGCIVGRREYHLLKERGYHVTLLGGGARSLRHFTEFVGGDMHITINWRTALELIEVDGTVESRIDVKPEQSVVDELSDKLPDFRKAFLENGLSVDEFADFGGVRFFRDMFMKGYSTLLDEITSRRKVSKRYGYESHS